MKKISIKAIGINEEDQELIIFHEPVINKNISWHLIKNVFNADKHRFCKVTGTSQELILFTHSDTTIDDSNDSEVEQEDNEIINSTIISFKDLKAAASANIIACTDENNKRDYFSITDFDKNCYRLPGDGDPIHHPRTSGGKMFRIFKFNDKERRKIGAAMYIVYEALSNLLAKFEAALPSGAGDLVWNIRNSVYSKEITVKSSPQACGTANLGTHSRQHEICFTLSKAMVNSSSIMGIAIVIIHEIAHQFGVDHPGHNRWINTDDFEGALWAAHKVRNVKRENIRYYFDMANREIGECAKLKASKNNMFFSETNRHKNNDRDNEQQTVLFNVRSTHSETKIRAKL